MLASALFVYAETIRVNGSTLGIKASAKMAGGMWSAINR